MKLMSTMWGIGPKLVLVVVPYYVLTVFFTSIYPVIFNLLFLPRLVTMITAFILLFAGLIFFINTIKTFYRGYKTGKLITTGTYSLCRNPIYATFIVFFIPATALFLNSWLSLTASIIMYLAFKRFIRNEYSYLKDKFGNEYCEYEKNVNEIFPIKRKTSILNNI